MTCNRLKFSICITTCDRWELCLEVVESILHQTHTEFELIVVDDSPNSVVPEQIKRYVGLGNLHLIKNNTNLGLAKSRNIAISLASGDYFAFCDDDDIWDVTYLESLAHILKDASYDFVYSYEAPLQKIIKYLDHRNIFKVGYTPPVAGQCYKLQLLKENNYNNVKQGVDHDLWIQLLDANPVGVIRLTNEIRTNFAVSNTLKMTKKHDFRKNQIQRNFNILWKANLLRCFDEKFTEKYQLEYLKYLKMKQEIDEYKINKKLPSLTSIIYRVRLAIRYKILRDFRVFFL
jgi:glycosyltransferase involved in cell wall biosynthesis